MLIEVLVSGLNSEVVVEAGRGWWGCGEKSGVVWLRGGGAVGGERSKGRGVQGWASGVTAVGGGDSGPLAAAGRPVGMR